MRPSVCAKPCLRAASRCTQASEASIFDCARSLEDKSRVGIIVDYSRDYIVLNGMLYFFQLFCLLVSETAYFNLPRSAK